jgi:HrpA-like RNA helicase
VNQELPILKFETEIVQAVRDHQVVVVAAETGAGKSTEVPAMLLSAKLEQGGMIGVTQPRRVAAMSLAQYVAEQNGCELGGTIGFQISGERALSRQTKIKYMTEGILLREMHGDPDLHGNGRHPGYGVIVVDEAHERGVNQDLIMALLKKILRRRQDLKAVIMSATIDVRRFADYFGCSSDAVIEVPGRVYDVEVRYASETPFGAKAVNVACAEKIGEILAGHEDGDVLVFMPDEKSIKQVCELVEQECSQTTAVLPLYGNQPPEEQRDALKPRSERRVIVATNIAETSLTVDGVVHVVDSGLIKAMRYVNATMSALEITEHSKAGCDQRKGRAGRTRSGICHRLFTRRDFEERDGFTKPEILRMSLDQVLLHLRVLGYSMDEIVKLEFMDPPSEERWREAEALLKLLGALDADSEVTEDGYLMERLAAAPMIARMLLSARDHGCTQEMVVIAAGFVSRPVFVRPRDKEMEARVSHYLFQNSKSDALTLIKVWKAWCKACETENNPYQWARDNYLSSRALREIERNRDQMLATLKSEGIEIISSSDETEILKAVASGLIVNLCVKTGQYDYTWQGRSDVFVHPGSGLFSVQPNVMVCTEVVSTTKVFARQCTAIEQDWLSELIPEHALEKTWNIQRPYGETPYMVVRLSWQGTLLSEERVEEFPATALPALVAQLVDDIKNSNRWSSAIHPQANANKRVYDDAKLAVMESTRVSSWEMSLLRFNDLDSKLTAILEERIKSARSLREILEADLSFRIEDLFPEDLAQELVAKLNVDREEREARQAAYAEQERLRREEEDQRRREMEAAMQPIREKASSLLERVSGLAVTDLQWRLQSIRDSGVRYWFSGQAERLENELSSIESEIARHEQEYRQEIGLSDLIWKTVLEQFPSCPLCGSEWKASGSMQLDCFSAHDYKRIIHLQEAENHGLIGSWQTNNGNRAASIVVGCSRVSLQMVVPRNYAWQQSKFKHVAYHPFAAILPVELAGERQTILKELADLRQAREELETTITKIKRLEHEASQGKVKRLTFKTVNGVAEASEAGRRYRSVYQEAYPQNGETWFCLVNLGMAEAGCTHVTPVFKAGSVSDPTDLEELRTLIREVYPGIPEELLH